MVPDRNARPRPPDQMRLNYITASPRSVDVPPNSPICTIVSRYPPARLAATAGRGRLALAEMPVCRRVEHGFRGNAARTATPVDHRRGRRDADRGRNAGCLQGVAEQVPVDRYDHPNRLEKHG